MNSKAQYNPDLHHRKSIRLKGYDYSQAGWYFITICCQGRMCRFGEIAHGAMILNEYGIIACNEWIKLQERFANLKLDVFQIMPNHMHGIIALHPVGATLAVAHDGNAVAHDGNDITCDANKDDALNDNTIPDDMNTRAGASPAPTGTVSDIVGAYKSLVANGCLEIYKSKNEIMGKLWQRNFYEHIIRNEQSYHAISNYIMHNPSNWKGDKFYT